ncbi:hypothetical protein [Algoriphagus sp.]|uniref:hypothetical protein n=1 Tax=Algoriphagus sp. TaxID=1872435 RepID=UPI0025DCF10D|nr:hypothetical protein [Algoriphagus sp.]
MLDLQYPNYTQPRQYPAQFIFHENPVRAGIVEKPEDFLYSRARNPATASKYLGLKGLIDVDYW